LCEGNAHIEVVFHFTMKTLFASQYGRKLDGNSLIFFWLIFLITTPFKLYLQNICKIMFIVVVLPCVVVNRIIIIGSLSKNYVVICCLSHNCILKLGFCCCVFNCGMFMCRFLEVHPIRLESINATCNKVREHVWPYILRMNTNNL
jgi:hypothetical protein